ncbi:riboflavin synthase [Patescibacteria group bacterium]|nr:riboflavin synthase [Patescibacteria group bacterium]
MFTGIITDLGTVFTKKTLNDMISLTVTAPKTVSGVCVGESIAIDGVCTTVVAFTGSDFTAQLMPETLEKTTLGMLNVGDTVNLEKSLKVGDPISGHFVFGHVDTVIPVRVIAATGDSKRFTFELPKELDHLVAQKGSIALNGVSLTVSKRGKSTFSVDLIPHTLVYTTFKSIKENDNINVEVDMLARYACQCKKTE